MPAAAVASNFGVPSVPLLALIWVGVPVMLILGLVRSPLPRAVPVGTGPALDLEWSGCAGAIGWDRLEARTVCICLRRSRVH